MKINLLLLGKKPKIVKKWFDLIVETYPPDTSNFLKRQKNRFDNPVGYTFSDGIEGIFDELVSGGNTDKVNTFLDNIIRVRAIQEFTPSQAINFIFLLKKAIREELIDEVRENQLFEDLSAIESKIDELSIAAFDIYMQCREKFYEIRVNELRNWTNRILHRSNMLKETSPEEESSAGL
ncbi:MAG: hypothetical protein GTN76_12945 [Candidatus Aenigmarchaeota archaeon]|nr:hypothetical protein [Candidatus Aenigmarchaeota archaeon]